jgi:hypothetical protein
MGLSGERAGTGSPLPLGGDPSIEVLISCTYGEASAGSPLLRVAPKRVVEIGVPGSRCSSGPARTSSSLLKPQRVPEPSPERRSRSPTVPDEVDFTGDRIEKASAVSVNG